MTCSECGGHLRERYIMPGGAEYWADNVPYSDSVLGIESIEQCTECGARYSPESGERLD